MNIHVVYANVGAVSSPQAQIIGAEYQFICQPELRFQVPHGTVPTLCVDTVPYVMTALCRELM